MYKGLKKHRILYIDEQKSEARKFKRRFKDFIVESWLPEANLDLFVEKILASNFMGIIVDFLLSEHREDIDYHVPYNGAVLVDAIWEKRAHFPCIVLTSFDNDAVDTISDINYVYSKILLNQDLGKVPLQEKMRIMIDKYEKNIEEKEKRFHELLAKMDKQQLTEAEENELLKIDSFLEESLGKNSSLPEEKKKAISIDKIVELIDSTNNLIEQLKKDKR